MNDGLMKTKKTVIVMGYRCNNKCIFCCMEDRRKNVRDKTTKEIMEDIKNARTSGTTYLELIGGEPTIRKDIFRIVSYAKKLGFGTIMFATNGRMFSNKNFAKKVIDAGVNHIVFSIHGHNAKLHDSLTKVDGSFEQLLKGIKNIQDLGLENIGTNTTIVKQNFKHLLQIGKLIYSLGIRNSEFIFVDPTHGAAKNNFMNIVPEYGEVAPYVHDVLEFASENNMEGWHIRYYPLCYIDQKHHNHVSESHEVKSFHTKHVALDFRNNDVETNRKKIGKVKINACSKCQYNSACEGMWKEYLKNYLHFNV